MGKRWRNASGQRIRLDDGSRMRDDTDCCCGGDPCASIVLTELAGSFSVEGVITVGSFRYIDITAPPPSAGFAYCGGETWTAQAPCGTSTSATTQATTAAHASCSDLTAFTHKVRVLVGSAATFYAQLNMTLVDTATGIDCTSLAVWCMGTIGCDNATILDQGVVGVDVPNCANASNGYNFGIAIPATLTMDVELDLIAQHSTSPIPSDECAISVCDGTAPPSSLSIVLTKTTDTANSVRYSGTYAETASCLEFSGGAWSLQPQSFDFVVECSVRIERVGSSCYVQASASVLIDPGDGDLGTISGPIVSNNDAVPFPPIQPNGSTYVLGDYVYTPCAVSGMEWGYSPPTRYSAYYNGVIDASFTL